LRDISREAELDRIKDEFISTVSHELRTPMTPIKGYTDLLVNNKVGPLNDLQLKFLRVIKTNADRLDSLVNDILDISRIDAERVKLDNKPIKLSGLIRQVLPTFEYQIGEKNLALTLHIPDSLPPVYADPDRVTQILVNLIGNSVKYSRPDDKINIVVTAQNDYVRVDIQDTGLGISEEDLAQVFDRFFRAERDVSSVVDGTGLGLPIAKNFVELMGGKIWASSELEVGSTFSFTLPAAKQNPIDGNEPTV
jgi:signal transduction histidine kinase